MHTVPAPTVQIQSEEARIHICDDCGKRFKDQPEHYQHIRKFHRRIGMMNAWDASQGMLVKRADPFPSAPIQTVDEVDGDWLVADSAELLRLEEIRAEQEAEIDAELNSTCIDCGVATKGFDLSVCHVQLCAGCLQSSVAAALAPKTVEVSPFDDDQLKMDFVFAPRSAGSSFASALR